MNKRKTTKANLESKRIIFLEIGFIVTLAAVLYAFEYKTFDQIIHLEDYHNNYFEEEELPPLVMKEKEVLPERPKPQTIINVVDDHIPIDEEIIIDVSIDSDEGLVIWLPEEEPDIIDDEDPLPLIDVSDYPEFPGGEAAMYRFLADHYKIPRIDVEQGNQGTIFVQFVIDKEGIVKDATILRSVSATADAEAIKAVLKMPKWKPAQQGIKKVNVRFVLPIHVKLM